MTSGRRTILQMDARQHARPYKTNPKVVRNGGFLTWGVGRNHPPGRPLQVTQDAVAPSYPLYAISWLSWFPHSPVRPGRSKCVCFFWQFGSGRSWNRRVRVRRSHSRSVDIGLEMSNRWVRRGGGGGGCSASGGSEKSGSFSNLDPVSFELRVMQKQPVRCTDIHLTKAGGEVAMNRGRYQELLVAAVPRLTGMLERRC